MNWRFVWVVAQGGDEPDTRDAEVHLDLRERLYAVLQLPDGGINGLQGVEDLLPVELAQQTLRALQSADGVPEEGIHFALS